jgi:hypothetical protein
MYISAYRILWQFVVSGQAGLPLKDKKICYLFSKIMSGGVFAPWAQQKNYILGPR